MSNKKHVVPFTDAPLGARFRYASDGDEGKIWIKICDIADGLIAEYDKELIKKPKWTGQQIRHAIPGNRFNVDIVLVD